MKLELTDLNRVALEFVGLYRRKLIDAKKRATGELINNTGYVVQFDDRYLTISLELPEEWKYVEYGRRAGAKMPPIDVIKKWIKIKPLLPRANKDGKIPTTNQLAFLVARKIGRDGIPAGNYLAETEGEFDLIGRVYSALGDQINAEIAKEVDITLE